MKKFRFISLALVVAMCCAIFTGCGKKVPTAEELINGAFGPSEPVSASIDVFADIDAKIDMSAIGMESSMEASGQVTMNFFDGANGKEHMVGRAVYKILGMSSEEAMENYRVKLEDGSMAKYDFDKDEGVWVKGIVEDEGEQIFMLDVLRGLVKYDETRQYEVKPVEDGDTEYVVTTKFVLSDLGLRDIGTVADMFGEKMDVEMPLKITMKFDMATNIIDSCTIELDTENASDEVKAMYNNISIDFIVNSLSGITVEIPEEVIESAVEEEVSVIDEETEETAENIDVEATNNGNSISDAE